MNGKQSRMLQLLDHLACPACLGDLKLSGQGLECCSCQATYSVKGDIPVLLLPTSVSALNSRKDQAENIQLRSMLGRYPRLLKVIDAIRPPHPFLFLRSRANRAHFSKLAQPSGNNPVFLDIGSGIHGGLNASGLTKNVLTNLVPSEIDLVEGVGVVADAHRLPWKDDSLDGVLIQGVLEHVADPEKIVSEIFRTLKPGAPIYVDVPFIQHYHQDPFDFRRYTLEGLEQLFSDFEKVDSGVAAGPASALTDMLTEFPSVLFKSSWAYWFVKTVLGWLFSPIQLLDVFWSRAGRAHMLSGAVYYLGRSPEDKA